MPLPGIHFDRFARDDRLAQTLRTDHMTRFRAVPRTVMINQWPDDLEWLIVDATYPAQIARRLELLRSRADMLIDRLPGRAVRAAEEELRDTVADYLIATYPDYFRRDGDLVLSLLTGLAIDIGPSGADPLVACALLASEDLLLLLPEQRDGQNAYVLQSGALLFPNDWSLRSRFGQPEPADPAEREAWRAARDKSIKAARLGKTPYEIHHGHVTHYVQEFASRVDQFFSRMEPGMRTWRRNWGMRLTDELCLHSDALPPDRHELSAANWERRGFLRSEQETFLKLPRSGAVVFGIKTYLWKLSELMQNEAAREALLTADENLAPAMFDYRADSLPTFREFLRRQR